MEFMEVSVIHAVLSIVKTTRVRYWMELVLDASQGGQGQIVTKVGFWANLLCFEKKLRKTTCIKHLNQNVFLLTECVGGWYGINCTQQCVGHCLNNVVCNHETGQCDGGCAYEWYGQYCNETCDGHCLNNTSCNQGTGQCYGGCAYGWYGQYCNKTCIEHCINNATCNQDTGLCDGGCNAGWKGYKCDEGMI